MAMSLIFKISHQYRMAHTRIAKLKERKVKSLEGILIIIR